MKDLAKVIEGASDIRVNSTIKGMNSQEQVALLFAFVFGVLVLCSVIYLVRSLFVKHPPSTPTAMRHPFLGLLKTSWFFAGIFWLSWSLGDRVATVLFALISFFTLREFISLSPTKRGDHRSLILVFFFVIPLQYTLMLYEGFNLFTAFIPVYVFLLLPVVSSLGNDPHMFLERNAKLQWGLMVCVYGLSHVPALLMLDFPVHNGRSYAGQNMFLLFYLVCLVQMSMAVQHIAKRWLKVGTRAGDLRAPSYPQISQSFNWLPWLIGVLVASTVGAIIAGITPFHVPAQGFALSFIACAAGSLGHLVMKAIKRDRGVTHWSGGVSSITGAGGLLDRMDGLCFAAPVFFHVVHWYYGL